MGRDPFALVTSADIQSMFRQETSPHRHSSFSTKQNHTASPVIGTKKWQKKKKQSKENVFVGVK